MKMYTIGCYKQKLIGGKYKTIFDKKFIHSDLKPMTHEQACIMISKMMQPSNWFVVPLN